MYISKIFLLAFSYFSFILIYFLPFFLILFLLLGNFLFNPSHALPKQVLFLSKLLCACCASFNLQHPFLCLTIFFAATLSPVPYTHYTISFSCPHFLHQSFSYLHFSSVSFTFCSPPIIL